MFQLIEPIWLLAMAGIAIPVIIHLWNIKKGKTLKVGSIAFLIQRSRQSARSLRLSDILLLVLRCLFISLLAMLLSKPLWQQPADQNNIKGWILIEPGRLTEVYPVFKPLIDSLLHAGFEFHYFREGFKKDDLQTILKNKRDTSIESPYSYWSLLQLLERAIPDNLPVQLFTGNRLIQFSGNRPGLSLNLSWHTYTPSDSVFSATAAAYLTSADSIRVIKYISRPTGTSYATQTFAAALHRYTDYFVHIESGKLMIADNRVIKNEVEVDTTTLRIAIYTDNFINDAYYLKAALEAIQQYTSRKINVSLVRSIVEIPPGRHWLFWLSEKPVSKGLHANNIFSYENGKPVRISSSINYHRISLASGQIALYQLISADTSKNILSESTWQDGFGKPVLLNDKIDNCNIYHFFSRFDPDWNDLVWSDKFAEILLELILGDANGFNRNSLTDKRVIDTQQLKPAVTNEKHTTKTRNPVKRSDLSMIIWLAAFTVFFLERILSFNKKKQETYG